MRGYHFAALLLLIPALLVSFAASADQDPGDSLSAAETAEENAKEPEKKAKDPNRGRFLPIPIIITEPAIGEGLGLALTYFHRSKDTPNKKTVASPGSIGQASKEQTAPPTVTGVFGAYTSNETAAGGIGHMNTFRDDHIRFTGVIGVADVNSTFYVLDQPFKFNLRGAMTSPSAETLTTGMQI